MEKMCLNKKEMGGSAKKKNAVNRLRIGKIGNTSPKRLSYTPLTTVD